MENIPVRLNDKLIHFISKLNLKFTYNSCVTIDLLDYFQLLKQGITSRSTIKNIIAIYISFYKNIHPELVDEDKSFFETFNSDINLFFINDKYDLNRGGILRNLILLYTELDFQTIEQCDENLSMQINLESLFAQELGQSIKLMKDYVFMSILHNCPYNRLCELLISLKSNDILLQKLLLNDNVDLIYSILNNDIKMVHNLLYINNIDPRLGNNELYKLSINKEHDVYMMIRNIYKKNEESKIFNNMFKSFFNDISSLNNDTHIKQFKDINNMSEINTSDISDMIKDVSIKRNWLEKQMLTNILEESIGESDLPDVIFNIINTLR